MAKPRNYKREYRLFQSSAKRRKYRAALNKHSRRMGTYGNGDHKDWAHHGGKITRMESEHQNRGTIEKSRRKGSKRKKHR